MRSGEFVIKSFILTGVSLDELEKKLALSSSSSDSYDVVDVNLGGVSFIDGVYVLPVSVKKEIIVVHSSPR